MTDWEVGKTATVTIPTPGGAGDTTLALTVTDPALNVTHPTATPNAGHTEWTLLLPLTLAGDWTIVAVASGSGFGEASYTIHAAPQPPPSTGLYATTQDYADYFGVAPPDGLARTLRLAGLEVRKKTLCAVYAVDDNGLPTDATIKTAFTEATCEQAYFMILTGRASGVDAGRLTNVTVGRVSYGNRGGTDGVVGGAPGDPTFSGAAWSILQAAGLTGWGPQS